MKVWARATGIILLVAVGAVLLLRFSYHRLDIAEPLLAPPGTSQQLQATTLALSVEVPLAELTAWANREVPEVLYQKEGVRLERGMKLRARVERSGPVSIRGTENGFTLSAPLRFDLRLDWKLGVLGKVHRETSGALTVHVDSKVGLDGDWNIESQLQPSFRWDERPKIKLGPIKIRISKLAGKAIQKQLNKLASKLNDKLNAKLAIREKVLHHWKTLPRVIPLEDDPPAWLAFQVEKIELSRITGDTDVLQLHLGVKGQLSAVVGARPDLPHRPLPELGRATATEEDVRINLPISVSYHGLAASAVRLLGKKPLRLPDGTLLEVKQISITGSADRLLVGVELVADPPYVLLDTRGTIYLTGKPVYDAASRVLRVDDFDFHEETSNYLLKTAAWLIKPMVVETIRKRLSFQAGPQIDRLTAKLDAKIEKLEIGKVVTLRGRLDSLEFNDLFVNRDRLSINLFLKGQFSGRLQLR